MSFQFKDCYTIDDLKDIMHILRSDEGCPWDKEQTHQSIRNNFIEETYEVVEAIDKLDMTMLREELGDVLLQVIFHSHLEAEKCTFNFDDVVNDICVKLIARHPLVFSDTIVQSTEEVLSNWNAIKKEQKGHTTYAQTLDAVPRQLPALMRAKKIQERAKKAGFCYPSVEMALVDLKSEIVELEQAISNADKLNIEEEIGDILFSIVNVSRLLGNESEEALTKSSDKFINRFTFAENIAKEQEVDLKMADMDVLCQLWKQAKIMEFKRTNPHEDKKL